MQGHPSADRPSRRPTAVWCHPALPIGWRRRNSDLRCRGTVRLTPQFARRAVNPPKACPRLQTGCCCAVPARGRYSRARLLAAHYESAAQGIMMRARASTARILSMAAISARTNCRFPVRCLARGREDKSSPAGGRPGEERDFIHGRVKRNLVGVFRGAYAPPPRRKLCKAVDKGGPENRSSPSGHP